MKRLFAIALLLAGAAARAQSDVPQVTAHIQPDSVMIGDRRFDIEGAAAAGMESIGVLWGYGSREELEKASPDYLAADIPELRRILG